MKVLMAGPDCIHTTRQVEWVLKGGCRVVLMGSRSLLPEDTNGYRFFRHPLVRGAKIYRKLLPGARAQALIDWQLRVHYRLLWRAIRPDVVHVNWLDDTAYYFARAGVKPLLLTVWGTDVNQHFLEGADENQRHRAQVALSHAHTVIVDSTDLVEKCTTLAGKPLRTEILPLGIDTNHFRPGYTEAAAAWRVKLAIPAASKVILSIRACLARYGHETILEAFARALPKLNGEAILIFRRYSPDREEAERLESHLNQKASSLGVSDRIRWMDACPHSQIPELYALSDLIVNYPDHDAFPVTFIEAAACCRPVVSCRLPAYEGTFAQEFFQFVPRGADALADAMCGELSRPVEKSAELRSSARDLVVKHFDESVTSTKLLRLYEEAAKETLHRS